MEEGWGSKPCIKNIGIVLEEVGSGNRALRNFDIFGEGIVPPFLQNGRIELHFFGRGGEASLFVFMVNHFALEYPFSLNCSQVSPEGSSR
jgi:hypothetical protein